MTTATKHKTADRLTAEERHELPTRHSGFPKRANSRSWTPSTYGPPKPTSAMRPDNKKAALARRILAKAAAYGVNVQSQVIRSWAEE